MKVSDVLKTIQKDICRLEDAYDFDLQVSTSSDPPKTDEQRQIIAKIAAVEEASQDLKGPMALRYVTGVGIYRQTGRSGVHTSVRRDLTGEELLKKVLEKAAEANALKEFSRVKQLAENSLSEDEVLRVYFDKGQVDEFSRVFEKTERELFSPLHDTLRLNRAGVFDDKELISKQEKMLNLVAAAWDASLKPLIKQSKIR